MEPKVGTLSSTRAAVSSDGAGPSDPSLLSQLTTYLDLAAQKYLPSFMASPLAADLVDWPGDHHLAAIAHLEALLDTVVTYLPHRLVREMLHPLAHDRPPGRIIQGTLLLADISGFSTMADRLSASGKEGIEEVTDVINRYFRLMLDVAANHGGEPTILASGADLLNFGGDAMLLLFASHPLDAIRAALEMQHVMAARFSRLETSQGTFALGMHIGINTGRFLVASVGRPQTREYAVVGRAVNETALVEAAAGRGQVVIGQATRQAAGDAVRVREVGPGLYAVEGVAGGRPAGPANVEPGVSPLVQRDDPLARLERAVLALELLTPYLPAGLLNRLKEAPGSSLEEGEFRRVTVLFANVLGMSEVVETLGPAGSAEATSILDRYLCTMQDIIARYGGTVNKLDLCDEGDKLLVFFGAPQAHEDDPQRAVRAALEMQEAMRAFADVATPGGSFSLRQRIGINTGHVFAGNVGSPSRKEYTVMGDTVNLAARLMAAAEVGHILISPSTRRYLNRAFVCDELPPIRVKGKADPVAVCRVTGLSGTKDAARHGVMVGRRQEMAILKDAVGRALAGQGQVVSLIGPAGVGKSRLVDELAAHAATVGLRILRGACLSHGVAMPYLPWSELLRAHFGWRPDDDVDVRRAKLRDGLAAVAPELADWSPVVAGVLGLAEPDNRLTRHLDARLRKERFFDVARQLLQASAAQKPLLLIFEDLHWADPISLELLAYVARNVADSPILLIGAYRPDIELSGWQELAYHTPIVLDELSDEESLSLARALLNVPRLPDKLKTLVLEKAQGNPFFVEEVVHVLIDKGHLVRTDGGYQLVRDLSPEDIPDTVSGLVMSRIDSLDEGSRNVLRVASAIGRVFPYHVVHSIYPYLLAEEVLRRRLEALDQADLTSLGKPEPDLEYVFKHILTQEVAYDSLLYTRRRQLHGAIARYYEQRHAGELEAYYDLLAHHYGRSAEWGKAVDYALRAGRRAKAAYANEAAIEYFRQAIELMRRHELEVSKLRLSSAQYDLAEVCYLVGRYDEALRNYRASLDVGQPALSAVWRAKSLRKIGLTHQKRGDFDQAMESLQAAQRVLEESPLDRVSRQMARVFSDMGTVYAWRGALQQAVELGQRALDILRRLPVDHKTLAGQGWVYSNLAVAHAMQGDYPQAERFFLKSLQAREQAEDLVGVAISHNNLGYLWYLQGDYRRAIESYRACLEIEERVGDTHTLALALNNLGICYHELGRYEEATAHYRDSLALRERIGDRQGIASSYDNLGLTHHHWGEYERALDYHHRSLHLKRAMKSPLEAAASLINIGAVCYDRGNCLEAIGCAEEAIEVFRELGSKHSYLAEAYNILAGAHLALGEVKKAEEYARLATLSAGETKSRKDDGVAYTVLGEVYAAQGKIEQADECFRQGIAVLREVNNRFELGRSLRRYGQFLRRQGEGRAAEYLTEARAIFEELGARGELANLDYHGQGEGG